MDIDPITDKNMKYLDNGEDTNFIKDYSYGISYVFSSIFFIGIAYIAYYGTFLRYISVFQKSV